MRDAKHVLVVDDHPMFRDALELAVRTVDADIAVRHAESLSEAKRYLEKDTFDLILLDLNMSDSTEFEAVAKLRGIVPDTPILVVSALGSQQAASSAKALGAQGFISKSTQLRDMADAISRIMAGGTNFQIQSSDESADGDNPARAQVASLTPAQQRVMSCLSDGLLNKQIAFEMGITEATVKAHMTAIFRKLGANNRTQALLVYRDATRL
ncbi:MAG: response regulator transcription factor [Pseudomonadota bacterium]